MFRQKVYLAIFLVFLVLVLGSIGYHYFWGANWVDALYMTVITVSTVGYEQVVPLDAEGKIFTLVLIIVSLFTFGFAVSVLTQYLLSINNLKDLILKKKMKEISRLENHVILCGYGRNGKEAAAKLKGYKKPFVVIEKDNEIITKSEAEDNILFVEGDGTEDATLEKAGIHKAETIIAALPNDAENLFIVLTARQMNPKLTIISRASEESSCKKLKLAGADNVVMPDHIGGDHMAALIVAPELVEFIDMLGIEEDTGANLEQVGVAGLPEEHRGKSLAQLNLRQKTGCTVIGVKDSTGKYIINPDADLQLDQRSILIVLGRPDQIQKLREVYRL